MGKSAHADVDFRLLGRMEKVEAEVSSASSVWICPSREELQEVGSDGRGQRPASSPGGGDPPGLPPYGTTASRHTLLRVPKRAAVQLVFLARKYITAVYLCLLST